MIYFRLIIVMALLLISAPAFAGDEGFLFVTFRGEQTPMTEQIYFAISRDGREWKALNQGNPVLVSTVGEKGVRDPYILRTHDGSHFVIIATDLSINLNPDWKRAREKGSQSIVVWKSDDLAKWTDPKLAHVAPDDAGCTWAPEAVYDEEAGNYMVYWASRTQQDKLAKQRIWSAHTTDFETFTKPEIFIDKDRAVIDTDIVRDGNKYYRFSKSGHITQEVADKLAGPWKDVPGTSLDDTAQYEGPECYLIEPATADHPATWCLMLDHFKVGKGYEPFITHDLASGHFEPAQDFKFPFLVRHGSVLPVSEAELQRLEQAYH